MKKYLLFTLSIFASLHSSLMAQKNPPLWLRYPAISPNGKTIVFNYKGDIYKVDAAGGDAAPLTLSEGHDFMPVWSPDGKWIAFASDRNGNFDIYLVSAEGGTAQRLTYNSSNDFPQCFSADGKNVLFSSSRIDNVTYIQFPSSRLPELYSVPVTGGRETQILSVTAEDVKVNKVGDKVLFHDKKGYEDPWRKHQNSSIARDIWMYDKKENKFNKLTDFNGEDRNPIWSADEKAIYFLSEKSGSFNVWKMSTSDVSQQIQLTKFTKNPVRFLSASSTDVLCYSFNGEIYTQLLTGEPQKLNVNISTDERFGDYKTEIFKDGATEISLSPNGKEIVFVVRGEVYVTSSENGTTRRITNTPEQERNVSFSPDGRSILYASERNNIWGLYKTGLARKEESYFFNSTVLKEEHVLVGSTEAFQPKFSPDGNSVAYIEERTTVKVLDLKTKKTNTILSGDKSYSYSDGDQFFEWSPDGKYILVQFLQDGNWRQEIGLVDSEGKNALIDLTQSGFYSTGGKWMMNGKMMLWFSSRHGMKNVASHGSQTDAYGLFLTKEAYDRFKMNKEDYALLKEKEEKDKPQDKAKADSSKKITPVQIEMTGIYDRKVRLTIHSSDMHDTSNDADMADAIMSPDGEKLYYLCRFEGGYDLWINKFKESETKLFLKLDAKDAGDLMFDKEVKNIFLRADGKIVKVNLEKPEKKEVAFSAEMNLNLFAERAYFFEHAWRQVVKKFYVTDLQKTDWNYYKTNYVRFLPHINNNYDFSEMLSELLGELNASHTGCRYKPKFKDPDETSYIGAFFDEGFSGKGLKIVELIDKGPLVFNGLQIKAGTIIERINGVEITAEMNYYKLLNRNAGKYMLLSLFDERTNKRWEETIKPINFVQMNELLYQRWVKRQQDLTNKLSNGELGYMHVRAMNDESYREFYDQVMGKFLNKKALIVDTRFNLGGWMHDDLATFLSGKKYIDFIPRERKIGVEPGGKWIKPSVVLMSEGNYSDAHMFPVVYKAMGIGKLIGMSVPGTGTAVWWETLQDQTLVFGIPQVGVVTLDGKYCENNHCDPDLEVSNEYLHMIKGSDQQLEKAVKILLGN